MAVSVDMKALAGLDKYHGDKAKFPQFQYTFESLIATGSEQVLELMTKAEGMQQTRRYGEVGVWIIGIPLVPDAWGCSSHCRHEF